MDNLLAVQQRLIPDLVERMYRRLTILNTIYVHQPIGRRSLSEIVHLTERVLRTEIDMLKAERLIEVFPKGMTVTAEGESIIQSMGEFMNSYNGLTALGLQIKQQYQLKRVYVVKGDLDQDAEVKESLGAEAAKHLLNILTPDDRVTVTGGSTTATIAEHLNVLPFNIEFTPARGGLGESVTHQANAIVARMAKKTGGTYHVLYVPDQVSETTYNNLIEEPAVKAVVEQIKSSDIVIHGIGDAAKMAERRQTNDDVMMELKAKNAVGEAFGYYFDKKGNIVYKVRTIGLQLEDLDGKQIIAVAGGASKAEAIKAYLKFAPPQTILITDEAVAQQLLKG